LVNVGSILVIGGVVILFFAVGGVGGIRGFGESLSGKIAGAIPSIDEATASSGSEEEAIQSDQEAPTPTTFSVTQSRKNAGTLSSTVRQVSLSEFSQTGQTSEIARSVLLGSNVRLERGGTLLLDQPTRK